MRKSIPELVSLEARGPEEVAAPITVVSGAYLHTLLLEPTELSEVEALRSEGYLESYVVLPRGDGAGQYVSALVTSAQLRELGAANDTHRLAERGGFRAAVLEDFPAWARGDAGPSHVFFGVPVTTISGVL